MTAPAAVSYAPPAVERPRAASYGNAHWYFVASLAVIVAGFWPTFFRRPLASDASHAIHGATSTLWVVALAVQSWLMSRGRVVWHRRVARGALVLLPMMCVSLLQMVAVILRNPALPPSGSRWISAIDFPTIAFLLVLVGLGLRNIRTPAAHKRFMAATVLLGFPASLTRLYNWVFFPEGPSIMAIHGSFITVELILVALIVSDWRARERRLAYPLSLGFFVIVQWLSAPLSATAAWQSFTSWYAALRVFA